MTDEDSMSATVGCEGCAPTGARHRPTLALLLLAPALCGCGRGRDGQQVEFDVALTSTEMIVSLESGLLVRPSGLAVDSFGHLWVSDFGGNQLLVLNADGS